MRHLANAEQLLNIDKVTSFPQQKQEQRLKSCGIGVDHVSQL